MKTKICCLVALLLLLVPSAAAAQPMQPTPVVQAKSTKTLQCPAAAPFSCTGTEVTELSALGRTVVMDVAGYASMDVYTNGCAAGGMVTVWAGNTATTLRKGVYSGSRYIFKGGAAGEAFSIPLFAKYVSLEMPTCKAWAVATPFPSSVGIRGTVADGQSVSATGDEDTTNFPMLVGGVYSDNVNVTLAKTQVMDVHGYAFVTHPGLTTATSEEVLVAATATAMPATAWARSITLKNAGTDAIFCGFADTVTVNDGIKIGADQGATFDLDDSLGATPSVYCIAAALQTAGSGTRVILSNARDSVRLYGGGGSGGGSGVTAFAPGVPDVVALSASASNYKCGLTEGADYEISCTVPAAWRHGAATPTALITDTGMNAGAVRSPVRMPQGSTCFAFISTSNGSCTVSLLPTK